MIVCTKFEDEGLLAMERGEVLDKHFSECNECIEAQRVYLALKSQFASLGYNASLSDDWQQRVLESIAQSNAESETLPVGEVEQKDEGLTRETVKTPLPRIAASLALMAIAVLLFSQFSTISQQHNQEPNQLVARVIKGDTNFRGSSAKIGDSLELSFIKNGKQHSEIRVYLDTKIYFQCKLDRINDRDDLGCVVEMKAVGEYQSVLIQGEQPLGVPAENLDSDVLFARDSGLSVLLSESVIVR